MKVHGTDGPSSTSNIAVVPLDIPTFVEVSKEDDDENDDDENGVDFAQIAEIVFGTIGAVATVVPGVIFIHRWIKKKRSQKEEQHKSKIYDFPNTNV